MRYVIIGAGAVGGTIGGQLHRHGHQVTLVARGPHLTALRAAGLRLTTAAGEAVLPVPAVGDPSDLVLEPDMVLVLAVKSQDTTALLPGLADLPVRDGGVAGDRLPIVCAQNGVANERAALRYFARVYGTCVLLPATHLEPGAVVAEGRPYLGMLHLGRVPSVDSVAPVDSVPVKADPVVEQIAADLAGSGFLTPVRSDVMRWKYGKLLANLGNGPAALFGAREETDEYVARAREEGIAALAAAGIDHPTPEEEAAERADHVRLPPETIHRFGSTWQSIVRGVGSVEVDYLSGEIVLLGREHGVPTPVNLAVQRAVHAAVRRGIPAGEFPATEFRALLPGPGSG